MKGNKEIVEDWARYVNQVIGDASTSAVSEAMGGTPSEGTIRNWVNGDLKSPPDILYIRKFAEVYGRPLSEAYAVASGVRPEDVGEVTVAVKPDPSLLSSQELADELLGRAEGGGPRDHPLVLATRREVGKEAKLAKRAARQTRMRGSAPL